MIGKCMKCGYYHWDKEVSKTTVSEVRTYMGTGKKGTVARTVRQAKD
ncbi:MAG: hypothetical protein PUC30_03870 [Lachnospiraceae bacterium]|nr:hypothetical protein [Lachnospiraceae bacterium]